MKKLKVTVDGQTYEVEVEALESAETSPAPSSSAAPAAPPTAPKSAGGVDVQSPLAGKVVEVKANIGQAVAEGDTLLVLEAMKMNTLVSASEAGSIATINVAAGDMVEEGQVLLTIG